MGYKYTIFFMRNGKCEYRFDWGTNKLLVAIWWLIKLGIKYPIVDIQIRRGFIECNKCDADYCDKSAKWKEITWKDNITI